MTRYNVVIENLESGLGREGLEEVVDDVLFDMDSEARLHVEEVEEKDEIDCHTKVIGLSPDDDPGSYEFLITRVRNAGSNKVLSKRGFGGITYMITCVSGSDYSTHYDVYALCRKVGIPSPADEFLKSLVSGSGISWRDIQDGKEYRTDDMEEFVEREES